MRTPRDYDTDPDRYRAGMRLADSASAPSLHGRIVRLLVGDGAVRVLDVGCGEGALAATATGALYVIGVDAARTMVQGARRHGPTIHADLVALPVADGALDAVVAVNVLDHLEWPETGLREAHRVLRRGGLFVAGTISRADSPELAPYWHPVPSPFDTEEAPALVEAEFGQTWVQHWDSPLIQLRDQDAIRDYLRARFVPRAQTDTLARSLADRGPMPLTVTKRGALVMARRAS